MYLTTVSHYIPSGKVENSYFENVNGLTDQWIFERTGIKSRSKAEEDETTNTMAVQAVQNGLENLPYDLSEIDLIVGASYSPHDTVNTIGHIVQRSFNIDGAQVLYVSSACSSLLNAIEVAQGYMAMGKSKKALVVASEHNTAFSDEACQKSGHLWGDGATALFFSNEPMGEKPAKVVDVYTEGLGHLGKAPEAVYLTSTEGLRMPDGRDVFIHAVTYMRKAIEKVLDRQELAVQDINYIIPHQANMRIVANLKRGMKIQDGVILSNIEELGNTGCASTGICLSQHYDQIEQGDKLAFTVFGGGYSTGAALLEF